MAFHTDTIRPLVGWFKSPNMADVWMAVACQQKKTPIIMLPHDGSQFELIKWKRTIYDSTSKKDGTVMDASEQSNYLIRHTDWRLPPIVGR